MIEFGLISLLPWFPTTLPPPLAFIIISAMCVCALPTNHPPYVSDHVLELALATTVPHFPYHVCGMSCIMSCV